jgi:4'-phosphopantetheinyl transferase
LRLIVAQCIGISAERLRFEYNQFGKPYLADASPKLPLQFNVSHSGRLVLIALAMGRAVGIDVEQTQDGFETETIASLYFSAHEQLVLQSLPAHLSRDAFFACWTRKEAYIKAVGNGLSLPLNQFDVCIVPGKAAGLLSTRPNPAEARRWSMRALNVQINYNAALVVESGDWHLKMWDWPSTNVC